MIEKFKHIKNVGKFQDYSAVGHVTLRRVTLIYAENAQGKTTLSAILRSLSNGDARLIEERRTLGAQEPPDILLRLTGTNAHFKNGQWNEPFSHIEVFDPVFVNQNVYAGDTINFEQRRSLHGFAIAIGEESVRLAKEIEKHATATRGLNDQIRTVRGQIQSCNMELIGDDVEVFVALPKIEGLDRVIEEKSRETETLRQADSILSRDLLLELPLPQLPLGAIQDLLSRQLEDVSSEAERRVRKHFASCMDEHGESWVRQGMGYIKDNRCPFCGLSISPAGIVKAYQTYFSAAYLQLREDIARTSKQVQDLISDQHLLSLQQACNANDGHAEFWRVHLPADYPQIDTQRVISTVQDLKTTLIHHVKRKLTSPLAVVTPDEQLSSAQATYTQIKEQVDKYNATVNKINRLIEAKKADLQEADVAAAERELRRLQATKCRYSEPVDELCGQYSSLQHETKEHGEKKGDARNQFQQHSKQVLAQYQSQINQHLTRFGADFQIVETREEFYGGNPSIDYQLKIRNERVPLVQGEPNQPAPCFKNTLSSGDKATLAFALFVARLDLASDIQEKVIVFDDPISSLDCFRRMSTCQAIRRIAARAKQVIVLSHNPFFLRDIWDHLPLSDRQALWIARSGTSNHIVGWDICGHTQSPHESNYFMLRQFVDQGPILAPRTAAHEQDYLREVAKCIRPLLEHYIKNRCQGVFNGNQWWLGTMVRHIKECLPSDPASCLKPLLDELSDLNDYSAPFHHDQNPNADTHLVLHTELRTYVSRALALLQQ